MEVNEGGMTLTLPREAEVEIWGHAQVEQLRQSVECAPGLI